MSTLKTKKINVLIIMTTPIGTSGISEIVLRYYNNMNKDKIRFDFIVPNDPNEKIKKFFYKNNSRYYVEEGRKKIFKYYRSIKRIMQENKYDIVHVNGNSATMAVEMKAAKASGCKIRIAHTHNTKTEHYIIDKILRPILYKNTTTCFACGIDAGKKLYKNRKFYVIPNGNNLDKFRFNTDQRRKYRKIYNFNNEIVIGHVGRFEEQKNHKYIVEIFKKVCLSNKKAKLILIGSGSKEKEIKDIIEKEKLEKNVVFTGEIRNVNEVINACDVMILPSKYEGLPLVAIEWQANGLPIIASNKISKEIDKTNTIKFYGIEQSNIDEWTKEIEKIVFNEKNRDKCSIVNCEKLKEEGYDIKEDAKKLKQIYETLCFM